MTDRAKGLHDCYNKCPPEMVSGTKIVIDGREVLLGIVIESLNSALKKAHDSYLKMNKPGRNTLAPANAAEPVLMFFMRVSPTTYKESWEKFLTDCFYLIDIKHPDRTSHPDDFNKCFGLINSMIMAAHGQANVLEGEDLIKDLFKNKS
jgi:hypothetical protein